MTGVLGDVVPGPGDYLYRLSSTNNAATFFRLIDHHPLNGGMDGLLFIPKSLLGLVAYAHIFLMTCLPNNQVDGLHPPLPVRYHNSDDKGLPLVL